jgi:hypothetical protein
MLSGVLRSKRAIAVSVEIMRAFAKRLRFLEEICADHRDGAGDLDAERWEELQEKLPGNRRQR